MTMQPKNAVLKTKRLLLRPFCEDDLADAARLFRDNEVKKTYMLPDLPDDHACHALFDRIRAASADPMRIAYAISLDGAVIGLINDCGFEGDGVELGYAIRSDQWNRGYATEALEAVIGELFRMGVRRVEAAHFEGSEASGRVMRKAGMHPVDKRDTVEYRGQAHLCLYYEITSDLRTRKEI